MNKCSQCNSPIRSEQKFCAQCGAPSANLMAALMPGKLIASMDVCEKKIAQDPRNPLLYMEFGNLFMEFDIPDKALVQYQKAAAIDNTYIDAFIKSGDVFLYMGKFDHAQISYENALKIKADLLEARIGLFSALKGLGKLEDAVALGEEIIKAEPDLLIIRKSLREIYLQGNEEDKAIRENLKIISLAPSEGEQYKQLAQICEKRKDFSLALDIHRKVLELDPRDKDSLFFIGSMSYREGRYDESIKCFESLLLCDADNITARILLSLSYVGMGSFDQAIMALNSLPTNNLKLTDADSNNLSHACYLIGACRLREGNLSEAKNYLIRSLRFRKTEAAEKALAQVYTIEGDKAFSDKSYENAKKCFERALDLDASSDSLENKLKQVQKRLKLKRMTKVAACILVIGCIVFLSVVYFGLNSREENKPVTADKREGSKLVTVNRDVYLREGPGARTPPVGTLTTHTRVVLFESGKDSKGDIWENVRVESGPLLGKVGYVRKTYLNGERTADGSNNSNLSEVRSSTSSPEPEGQGKVVDVKMSDAHFNAGLKFTKAKRLQDAIPEYQEAVRYNPNNFQAYNLLGHSYLRIGDPRTAIVTLKKAVKIPNSDLWCHYNLSLALLANNNDQEALNEIKFITQSDPTFKAIIQKDRQFKKYCRNNDTMKEILRLS